jgi:hypothetical protein
VSLPDVDLDVAKRDVALAALPGAVQASVDSKGRLVAHPSGIYLQRVPVDPVTGLSAFPYDAAELFGYYKIDVLANSVYTRIRDPEHLESLMAMPVDWSWFEDAEFVSTLFHFHNNDMGGIVSRAQPASVDQLAMLIAIKMPAKRHLIGAPWNTIRERIWEKDPEGRAQFKKSHSIAYAYVVLLDAKLRKGG